MLVFGLEVKVYLNHFVKVVAAGSSASVNCLLFEWVALLMFTGRSSGLIWLGYLQIFQVIMVVTYHI